MDMQGSKVIERNVLRWYGTPPYCYILPIEINNNIKHNFINFFFSEPVT